MTVTFDNGKRSITMIVGYRVFMSLLNRVMLSFPDAEKSNQHLEQFADETVKDFYSFPASD